MPTFGTSHDVLSGKRSGHDSALHSLHRQPIKSSRASSSHLFTSSVEPCLSCTTSTPPTTSSPSKLAQSLRGSIRNLTWKTSQTSELGRRVFQRRRLATKEPAIGEELSEEFHLVTQEDIDPSPVVSPLTNRSVPEPPRPAHNKALSATPFTSLTPLIITDSLANRVSTYTTRTITTSDSATPTFTEFAHITASFPPPPTYIPTPLNSPLESQYPHPSHIATTARVINGRHTPSITSPNSEANTGSIASLQRIKLRAKDLLRIPSILSSWKSRN